MHFENDYSEYQTDSSQDLETFPDNASWRFLMKKSLYLEDKLINVPPIIINSTLSTEWPIFFNYSILSLT